MAKYNARKGKVGPLGDEFRAFYDARTAVRDDHAANPFMNGGEKADQATEVDALKRAKKELFAVEKANLDLQRRSAAVGLGLYQNQLKAVQKYRAELDRVAALERRSQLTAKYGRVGGGLAAFAESRQGQMLNGAGKTALAVGGGLVANGMSGTVEANRIAMELQLISRQLAGAFKPAIDEVTAGLVGLRQLLGSMTGGQQRALMAGGLALAGGYAAQRALVATTGGGLGAAAATVGLKRAGVAGAVIGEGISGYQGVQAAEASGGGASSYAREYGKRYIPIAPGVSANMAQGAFGRLQDAGRWTSRQLNGERGEQKFNEGQAFWNRNSFGLFGAVTGQDGTQPGVAAGRPKTAVTMPGGDVNELGSTFFEAMKAAGSIGGPDGETTLGGLLKWLRGRFGEAEPANPDQTKGK